jgi:transcription termination factor NusB
MEHTEHTPSIQKLKASAANQTEFVHGLLMAVMLHCQELDAVIEEHLSDAVKEQVDAVREALPKYLMLLAQEVEKIHPNNNRLD